MVVFVCVLVEGWIGLVEEEHVVGRGGKVGCYSQFVVYFALVNVLLRR